MRQVQHDDIHGAVGEMEVDVSVVVAARVIEDVRSIGLGKLTVLRQLTKGRRELTPDPQMPSDNPLIVRRKGGVKLNLIHQSASR